MGGIRKVGGEVRREENAKMKKEESKYPPPPSLTQYPEVPRGWGDSPTSAPVKLACAGWPGKAGCPG